MRSKLLVSVLGALLYALPVGAQVANEAVIERLKTLEDAIRSLERQISLLTGSLRSPNPPSPIADVPAVVLQGIGSQVKGASTATVAIIEFSDFECPFCGRHAASVYREIQAEFVDPGKVRHQFRHLPLEQMHPNARKAAEAAECAGSQGKFWEFHDRLFANQKALLATDLAIHARALNLTESVFAECLASGRMSERIAADIAEAKRLGLTGTPAFMFGEIQNDNHRRIPRLVVTI